MLRSALELELPIEATLGRFRVALTEAEGGLQLIVRDHGDGDRVLLETPPGEAFLRLGTGHLEIADSRGSFELTDTVRTLSAHQVVTGREFEPGRLTLRGRWGDAGPAWKARLAADGGRLAIGFELPEPPQDAKADHARLTLRLARDEAVVELEVEDQPPPRRADERLRRLARGVQPGEGSAWRRYARELRRCFAEDEVRALWSQREAWAQPADLEQDAALAYAEARLYAEWALEGVISPQ